MGSTGQGVVGGHPDVLEEAEGVGYGGELFGFACGVVSWCDGYGFKWGFAYLVVAGWEDVAFSASGLVCCASSCR